MAKMPQNSNGYDPSLGRSTRWYVVANRKEVLIYRDHPHTQTFQFLNRFLNADGTAREQDLDSDRPGTGRNSANGSIHHSLDRRSHRHEHAAEEFARHLARYLSSELGKKSYEEIILVAEPGFLGLVRAELTPEVRARVAAELRKEFSHRRNNEMREQIFAALDQEVGAESAPARNPQATQSNRELLA